MQTREVIKRSFNTLAAVVCLAALPVAAQAAEADAGLINAIKAVDIEGVRAALARGADVTAAEPDGTTPLHWATYGNEPAIVELLLEAGADVAAANRYGVLPISLASTNGNAVIAEQLLDAGADPNTIAAEGETALMTAARTGSHELVELLLDRGADVNAAETWRGQTALMWAAAEGHARLIPTMLSHGADLGARSEKGWTPLLFAVRQGHIGVVQTLLEAGVDIEESLPVREETRRGGTSAERSATGLNAFLLAAANAHYELAALLIDRGVDVNVAPRGWSALHQVSWVRKAGVAGSNNPAPKGSGNTTSLEFVRKLVDAGADLNVQVTSRPPAGITRLNFIAITPQIPDKSLAQIKKDGYPFEILSDLDSSVMKAYRLYFEVPEKVSNVYRRNFGLDLAEYNGMARYVLPVPGTYVIDAEGVVRAASADTDYKKRMEPRDIIAALREIEDR